MAKGVPKDHEERHALTSISNRIIDWMHAQGGSVWVIVDQKYRGAEIPSARQQMDHIERLMDSGRVGGLIREEVQKLGRSINMIIQDVSQHTPVGRDRVPVPTQWAGKLSHASEFISTQCQLVLLAHLEYIDRAVVEDTLRALQDSVPDIDVNSLIDLLTPSVKKPTTD